MQMYGSQWGSLMEGLEARLRVCKVFCMHAVIPSFPGALPTIETLVHKYCVCMQGEPGIFLHMSMT